MDDHAEDMLSFEFGVRTLGRISLEFIIKNMPKHFTRPQLSELPFHLYDGICQRVDEDFDELYPYTTSSTSTTNPLLNRPHVLHRGI